MRTLHLEQRTPNVEGKTDARRFVRRWTFDVQRSTFAQRRSTFAQRRGFTLVELLVVIMIIVAVTALAIGVTVPDVQTRRIRESARQINAHIQGAKARAAELGRPVAVIIQPDPANPSLAFTLKYAEVPPPYAGDLLTSVVRFDPTQPPAAGTVAATGILDVIDQGWKGGVVRAGDLIRFNHQGHYYVITAVDEMNNQWAIAPAGGTTNVVRNPGGPLRYQVTRQPVASAGFDLELPESVVVDLIASGPESGVFPAATATNPVTIIFSPGGSVLSCYSGGTLVAASRPLYLLVGNVEGVGAPYANLQDLKTIWVAINHQTGLVTSVENVGGADLTQAELNRAREFARKAQSLGGRS